MAVFLVIACFSLILVYDDLLTFAFFYNGRSHGSARYGRTTDGQLSVIYCKHFIKGNSLSSFNTKLFNLNDIAFLNLVLFTACGNNRVHNGTSYYHYSPTSVSLGLINLVVRHTLIYYHLFWALSTRNFRNKSISQNINDL